MSKKMGFFSWLFCIGHEAKLKKAEKLEKSATAVKVKDPDKAVALLRRAEVLQRKAGLHKSLLLQTRLRIATVL